MNHYQDFYQAALNGDEERIKALLSQGACIGELEQGSMYKSAAFQLAAEGKHDAVELLRKYGSSVNSIVKGYALVGNHQKVQEYQKRHGASPKAILAGYALGRHHEKVTEYFEIYSKEYFTKIKPGDDKPSRLATVIACNSVLAGCDDKAEELRALYPDLIFDLALSYAYVDNDKQVAFYLNDPTIQNSLSQEKKEKLIKNFALGYAIKGNREKLTNLFNRYPRVIMLDFVFKGFAYGGHSELISIYKTHRQARHFTNKTKLIKAQIVSTMAGHAGLAEDAISNIPINELFIPGKDYFRLKCSEGYIKGEHYEMATIATADKRKHTNPDAVAYKTTTVHVVKAYERLDSKAEFLFVLVHSRLNMQLDELMKALNLRHGSRFSTKECSELVKKAKRIKRYMQVGMDYEEANACYSHAREIMSFLFNDKLQNSIGYNAVHIVISMITGLEITRVPNFLEKVKKLKWHTPFSEYLNGKSPEKLLELFFNKLDYCINKYIKFAEFRNLVNKQSLARKISIDLIKDATYKLIDEKNKSPLDILIETIALIKGHIDATLEDHKGKSCLSIFTTPELVKAYREALSVLPPTLVQKVPAKKGILKEINLEIEKETNRDTEKTVISSPAV